MKKFYLLKILGYFLHYGVILAVLMGGLVLAFGEEVDLSIISKIESSNNPLAYNKNSEARGLYQITPIVLKEYNSHHTAKMPVNALFKPVEARKVAEWYIGRIHQMLRYYGHKTTIENILICYNAGIAYVVKNKPLPTETKNYIAKYKKLRG